MSIARERVPGLGANGPELTGASVALGKAQAWGKNPWSICCCRAHGSMLHRPLDLARTAALTVVWDAVLPDFDSSPGA